MIFTAFWWCENKGNPYILEMCNIYIVSHPHREPSYGWKRPKSRIVIGWNVSAFHRRKFIKRKGMYLPATVGTVEKGDIYFWGEYEAGSECTVQNTVRPKAVHDFLIPRRGAVSLPAGAMNTDPYVFGTHFKHICCGMHFNGGKYNPGDVILFGKVYEDALSKKHYMSLDTVFVVKELIPVDIRRTTTQYYNVGIKPTKKREFYIGGNYFENKSYFSFVPCKTSYSTDPLPVLDLDKMGFIVRKRFRTWTSYPISFSPGVWHDIISDVLRAGWKLGVHLDNI